MSLANVKVKPIRPQPYRLKWPLSPEQVENIDQMFEILFKATRQLKDGVQTVSAATGVATAAAMTGLLQPGEVDDSAQMIIPGPAGAQGQQGLLGPTMFLPQDAPDEPSIILVPGPQGPQGPPGVSLFGSLEDNAVEGFDMLRPGEDILPWTSTSVYNSAVESLASGAFAAATFDTDDWDKWDMHNPASNPTRVVIPNGGSGHWLCIGMVQFENNATGQRVAAFRVNGTTYAPGQYRLPVAGAAGTAQGICAAIMPFVPGDYVELMMYQDSGIALNTGSGSRFAANSLQLWRVSRAIYP